MHKPENSLPAAFSILAQTSHTMFMTLAARAAAAGLAPDTGFSDPYAPELLSKLPLDLTMYTEDLLLVKTVALRALLMDTLALDFIKNHPGTTGISLGCGLCSRGQRLRDKLPDNTCFKWYNVDLPEVIKIRDHYVDCFPHDKTSGCSITDLTWLDHINPEKGQPLLLVMEGVAPYLSLPILKSLFKELGNKVRSPGSQVELIFDYVHPLVMGSNQPFTITGDTKVVFHSGFANAKAISSLHPSFRVKAEHHFIENISGTHAGFNREFLEKTGGEHPYTVVQLCFDAELTKERKADDSLSLNPGNHTFRTSEKTNKIYWDPSFYPIRLSPTRLILAGEVNFFLLEGEEYRELLEYMTGTTSKEELVLQNTHTFNQAKLLAIIEKFMANGFIREIDFGKNRYIIPDFRMEPVAYHSRSMDSRLLILSQYQDPKVFTRWFDDMAIHQSINIIIADDYLDPRLQQIQADHDRPWILIKPTGKQPLTGPYFIPGDGRSPCLRCLVTRMLQNQSVRRWLQNRDNKHIIPLPVYCEEKKIQNALAHAAEKIKFMLQNNISTLLWSLSPIDYSEQSHPIVKRPQCRGCGDPALVRSRAESPVELKPCKKIFNSDGGSRSLTPSLTIKNISHLVSPITGIINDVSPLPAQPERGITIYRSSFFKTPAGIPEPKQKDFFQVSLGKGISKDQSQASALCESIERSAAHYQGDEFCKIQRASDLDAPVIQPGELVFYSDMQWRRFRGQGNAGLHDCQRVAVYDPDKPLPWTACWSLTKNRKTYVPFTFCYYNSPFETDAVIRFNSNGCAAGNTLEEALLQGFLELIERDATAVWWYNRVCRPSVKLDDLTPEILNLVNASLEKDWEYWVLDITHDFRIPVMAAMGRHKTTKQFRFGFGCHCNASLACSRALTELCQIIAIKDGGSKVFDFSGILPEPYLFPAENEEKKSFSGFSFSEQPDIKEDILYCIKQAEELGFEVLMHNYSRPDIPLSTVKVIIPGLCHIWPQFGNPRLSEVPVKMGLRGKKLNAAQLNAMNLFI